MSTALYLPVGVRSQISGVRTADLLDLVNREGDSGFAGECQRVQNAVGAAAARRNRRDRVDQRLFGDDFARTDVRFDHLEDQFARVDRDAILVLVHCRDVRHPHRADAQDFGDHRHRVGGVLPAARARSRTSHVLDLPKLLQRDLPRAVRANRFVDADDSRRLTVDRLARQDRPAVEHQRGHVQPDQRHDRAGHGLVAGCQRDHAVEVVAARHQFNRVGDDFAADERGFHAFRAHRDAVADADGVELQRRPTGAANAFFQLGGKTAQVKIAGTDLRPRVGDADQRLGEVFVSHANRLEHRPRPGAIYAAEQGATARVQRGYTIPNFG